MAMRGGPRVAVGSAAWIAEERSSAFGIGQSEIEEFSFSARNEVDWLNEHMAEIFSENQMNVAELFKTPGKLRGKTPRTARKANPAEARAPLSDIFSSAPKGFVNPFATSSPSQAGIPQFKVAEDRSEPSVSQPTSPAKAPLAPPPVSSIAPAPIPPADSGYHGSQTQDTVMFDATGKEIEMETQTSPHCDIETTDFAALSVPRPLPEQPSPTTASAEETFQSAREEQTTRQVTTYMTAKIASISSPAPIQTSSPTIVRPSSPITSPRSPTQKRVGQHAKSSSPLKSSPLKQVYSGQQQHRGFPEPIKELNNVVEAEHEDEDDDDDDELRSPSDNSSPIRGPLVRKSSLNFASLPAREPLTTNKSLGGPRASMLNQLEQTRASYYNRHTGGKSLGGPNRHDSDDDDNDEMDVDDEAPTNEEVTSKIAAHNKTYTQRLQDQISMLGKAQPNGHRLSKVLPNSQPPQQPASQSHAQNSQVQPVPETQRAFSPMPKYVATPGAFPEDDDDDWIAPPNKAPAVASPRPELPKSHSTDVMEHFAGKLTVGGSEFTFPKSRPTSPGKAPMVPERTTSTPGHAKSASVPYLPTVGPFATNGDDVSLKKTVSVSNPALPTVTEDGSAATPSKSSSRAFRDSPLKQVKNKLSSILKSSKGLLASSAAISAEGKSSMLSPSTSRLGYHIGASVDSFRTAENVLYPDLSQHVGSSSRPTSPTRSNSTRRTRASTEREKKELKEKKKEEVETKRMVEQMEKLEKAREKEREKARVFSQEQEKVAAMEKRIAAHKEKEHEKAPQPQVQAQVPVQVQELRTPAPAPKTAPRSAPSSPPKATRTSPRKTKGQAEADSKGASNASNDNDIEMVEPSSAMPPPSVPRSAIGTATRSQGVKRPVQRPKEKAKPTFIRVTTTSSSQFHPSNSVLGATLNETLGQQQQQQQQQQQPPPRSLNSKASQGSLRNKPSLQSLSSARPKALDLAAKRRAEEERETQRKREAKAEIERERRQDQQRKADAEKQKEEDRKQATKKAAIEKAKQTKAPPPASRPQPNGPPDYNLADKGPSRPPSRIGSIMNPDGRLVGTVLTNGGKAAPKRPAQDAAEDNARTQPQRTMPTYHQSKDAKRMRMSQEFDDDIDMADTQPNIIKGPPVRPSGGLRKDLPNKPMFPNGYQSASRDLYKATVTGQLVSQNKGNPLDLAQVSNGKILFTPMAGNAPSKTPVRNAPYSKKPPASKASPRFPNGDAIELPEIQTDDEDEDEDDHIAVAAWADSPALKSALLAQERVDPMQIFGPPAPLNMEEVFAKSKDRFHKFRARTSSANWSGSDRLTEEDIRKDLQARDKMRREGGWSYDLGRDMA
ncbi:hypothetical protein B0T25DRAFT_454263 [Lasiosphaeria hispida]|uniref:Inner centromere protein ARK-binding domain-containing protein n=1 Tax=Lasiosphaeria hispida TaxID=260671 RepID=A0AAJ0MEM5_9PEZI|nr:hypothetical protein B0T25DRAFT_454263 [Lasiosphaeria hispida]